MPDYFKQAVELEKQSLPDYIPHPDMKAGRIDPTTGAVDPNVFNGLRPGYIWLHDTDGRGSEPALMTVQMRFFLVGAKDLIKVGKNHENDLVAIEPRILRRNANTVEQVIYQSFQNTASPFNGVEGGLVTISNPVGASVYVGEYKPLGWVGGDVLIDPADFPSVAGQFRWAVIYFTGVYGAAPTYALTTAVTSPNVETFALTHAAARTLTLPDGAIRLFGVTLSEAQTTINNTESRFVDLRKYLVADTDPPAAGNVITVGDYADTRPASPTDGDTFIPKDGYWWEVYHDSLWNPYKNGLKLTAPPSAGWSWDNQGSATIDSSLGALHLYVPAGTSSLSTRARYRTAPSAPYTITVHLDLNILTATNPYAMVGFRQSSDGKLACLMFSMGTTTTQPKLFSAKFTNSTTHSANYGSADIAWIPEWIQIIDDNTNRILKYSKDGKNFLTLHSVGRTDFLTADQVFFGLAPISTANDASMTIYSWDES